MDFCFSQVRRKAIFISPYIIAYAFFCVQTLEKALAAPTIAQFPELPPIVKLSKNSTSTSTPTQTPTPSPSNQPTPSATPTPSPTATIPTPTPTPSVGSGNSGGGAGAGALGGILGGLLGGLGGGGKGGGGGGGQGGGGGGGQGDGGGQGGGSDEGGGGGCPPGGCKRQQQQILDEAKKGEEHPGSQSREVKGKSEEQKEEQQEEEKEKDDKGKDEETPSAEDEALKPFKNVQGKNGKSYDMVKSGQAVYDPNAAPGSATLYTGQGGWCPGCNNYSGAMSNIAQQNGYNVTTYGYNSAFQPLNGAPSLPPGASVPTIVLGPKK